MVDTLAVTTRNRAVDLTFATQSYGADLDPVTEILVSRVTAIRRHVAKDKKARETVRHIYDVYRNRGNRATHTQEENLEHLEPASPPWHRNFKKWRSMQETYGPVGLLLD